MDVLKRDNGLEFDHDGILHQEIKTVLADIAALKADRDGQLPFETEAGIGQGHPERRLVDRFKESRPQFPMDGDRCADDLLSDIGIFRNSKFVVEPAMRVNRDQDPNDEP